MNALLAGLKAQLEPLFDSELGKLGGLGVAAFGVQGGNHWLAITGGAFTVAMHFLDSVFNSPKGTKPA